MKPSLHIFRIPLFLAVAYTAVWFLQYSTDILGLYPVLDARENLFWAERITDGSLPREPFYRALLYPWVLSWMPGVTWTASLFGLVCHALNAYFVGLLAKRLWQDRTAAWGAGLLYGVYPTSLYFAVQLLDITLGITFCLAALVLFLKLSENNPIHALGCGLLIGLATLTRPSFLLVAVSLPLLAPLVFWNGSLAKASKLGLLIAISLIATLFAQGWVNQKLSGEWRVLPWQGAYNLYAANREGANGKYFQQQLAFDQLPEGTNPTRVESEILYRQAVGEGAPYAIDAMSAHWRERFFTEIQNNPSGFIGVQLRKILYLFNDWEQYNNLSYEYQRTRFSALAWNPLGWGWILVGGCAALLFARSRADRAVLVSLAVVGCILAGSVLIFFVSARFRLPLAPLFCVACGGFAFLRIAHLKALSRSHLVPITACAFLAVLTFGNWASAQDRDTFVQDQSLLAIAAANLALDSEAIIYARMVIKERPEAQDMRRIEATSLYNLWYNKLETANAEALFQELQGSLEHLQVHDAGSLFVAGVVAWKLGERDVAIGTWWEISQRFPEKSVFAAIALDCVGVAPVEGVDSALRAKICEILSTSLDSPTSLP